MFHVYILKQIQLYSFNPFSLAPPEKDDDIQQDCELFAKLIFFIGHVAFQ